GKYDVVRELQPQDLEIILRERQTTFAEAPSKNVFFLLWNQSSPFFALRQALTSVIRTQDLVRSALGRLGQPANGLLPPGILGHDPGRRRYPVSIEKGKER